MKSNDLTFCKIKNLSFIFTDLVLIIAKGRMSPLYNANAALSSVVVCNEVDTDVGA